MRLTVLGSSASCAGPGQACAGHLVEGGGAVVLFDCGNGVLANLGKVRDPLSVDAIFITHYHPDHYADLFALQAMLRYAPEGPAPALPLYLPEGLEERMRCLLSDRGSAEFTEAFEFHVLAEDEPVAVAGMTVTPIGVDHTEPTFALRAEADGALLAYTADSAPGEHVERAVEGADLVLSEATLPERYAGMAPHMTASQAGELAAGAGALTLVMVHVWPTNDRELMERLASEAFGGPAHAAREFDSYDVIPKGQS